jgi:hydroxysqualene synthase
VVTSAVSAQTADVAAAYASCERRARSHYENFPVGSLLLPSPMRAHVAAVYAFARVADDFADEGDIPGEQRLRLLDRWGERLQAAADGTRQPELAGGEPGDSIHIFLALAETMRACSLPVDLFADLLSAFRQDVTVARYANWDTLFDYARRSANPVGRLVLRIAGRDDARLDAWSDAICTALQFTNFWQDVDVDLARGRVYLPQSELLMRGGRVDGAGDEAGAAAGGEAAAIRRALRPAIQRTRQLFTAGRPLCDAMTGRLRYELRATWLGGTRILDRVERQLDAATGVRPTLGIGDFSWVAWHTLTWLPR